MVATHRFPLLVVFGFDPEKKDADEESVDQFGMECILFRPPDGENRRVHFGAGSDGIVRICLGEHGDCV